MSDQVRVRLDSLLNGDDRHFTKQRVQSSRRRDAMRSTKSVAKEAGTALLPAKEAGIHEPGDCPAKINGFRNSEVASRQHVPSSRCLRPLSEPRARLDREPCCGRA